MVKVLYNSEICLRCHIVWRLRQTVTHPTPGCGSVARDIGSAA